MLNFGVVVHEKACYMEEFARKSDKNVHYMKGIFLNILTREGQIVNITF